MQYPTMMQIARMKFVLPCALFVMLVLLNSHTPFHHHLLTAAQQSSMQGGMSNTCNFVGGFGAGLGVATFFGCVACGVGATLIGVGMVFLC